MKKENQIFLQELYPELLKHLGGDERNFPIAHGIECGDGWAGIIDDLLDKIEDYVINEKIPYSQIVQIKEKFGVLCVFITDYYDEIERLIKVAEQRSRLTCEVCGQTETPVGMVVSRGWYSTRCVDCWKKNKQDDDTFKGTNCTDYYKYFRNTLAYHEDWHALNGVSPIIIRVQPPMVAEFIKLEFTITDEKENSENGDSQIVNNV